MLPETVTGLTVLGLLGGLAVFLLGIDQITRTLRVAVGAALKDLLARLSSNPVLGALSGAFVTGVIQSSSITTVLVVGFVSAGLMNLTQAVGVIIGANIGSTVTVQVIAFDVTRFALAMIAVGFGLRSVSRWRTLSRYGDALFGLGLVFLGMNLMGDAVAPMRDAPWLQAALEASGGILLAVLAGAVFTALIQSSAATTGIAIVMASQGLITLPIGIAIALGSNVGTCVTAALAAMGRPRVAVRVAAVHVAFNVAGVLLWLGFIDQLAALATTVSPAAPELAGSARLAAETPRQIANAHVVFNVANAVLFIGFARPIARLFAWLIPDRPGVAEPAEPRYLDEDLLETPSVALEMARLEIVRLGEYVEAMLAAIMPVALTGGTRDLERVEAMDEAVDQLHGRIVAYLGRLGAGSLTNEQSDELLRLLAITNDLEETGDVIETNLVQLGARRLEEGVRPSRATQRRLLAFYDTVVGLFADALEALRHGDREASRRVLEAKAEVNERKDVVARHQASRLSADEPNRVRSYTREMEIVATLRRIYALSRHIARAAVAPAKR